MVHFVPEVDLPAFYAATDVLVVSPNSQLECMGQSMKEAMSAGKPIVGSNIGGIPEVVVHGKNGLLFNPESPKEIAHSLEVLIEDECLRTEMGIKGRKTAEDKFRAEVSAEITHDIFRRIVDE